MDGGSRGMVCIEKISESSLERTNLISTHHHPHSIYEEVASEKKEDKRISGKKHARESMKNICNSKSLVFDDDDDDFCLDSIQKRSQVLVVNRDHGVDATKGSSKAHVKERIIVDEVKDNFYVEDVHRGRKNDVHCRKKRSNYEKLKRWDLYVKKPGDITSKPSVHVNLDIIEDLKEYLSPKQLDLFRNTCFGHFLELKKISVQNQLIHYLLLREVYQENDDELWVELNGVRLRFGIKEFALMTGLNCTSDVVNCPDLDLNNDLIVRCFNGSDKIDKVFIDECFKQRRWSTDEDALKISILFFLHTFLFSNVKSKTIEKSYLDIVEKGQYNYYPWGKDIFRVTLESMKDRLRGNPKMYRIGGFPLAFQFWFYECCQRVKPQIAHRLEERIPRMLGWKVEYKPRYSLVSKHIAKMRIDKLYLRNISPTELEKEIMIKDVIFLANGPEKENTRDTTDKVISLEKVDEDATGNENVIEDVKEKCNKKEDISEHTNSRREPNVKEKELLMEREVFDETYIKRFNNYVDFSSPPRHIFDKQIRDNGESQSTDAKFKKLFDGQAMLNKEIGKIKELIQDKFVELFKALEIKNKSQEKETNNYGDEIGQVSKDGGTNSIYFQHLQDNQQDKIGVYDHDINVDNDKQEYCNVNDADENIERNNMDMLSAGEMVLYGQWGEILETQMVGVTKSQIIKPFTRDVPNNITPVNVPRKRRPAAVFKSPYVNDFSSGSKRVEDKQNNFAANVKLPFEASITEEVSFEMLHEFAKWVDIGLKGKRGTPYSKKFNKLAPIFDFGVSQIKEKSWFFALEYSGEALSNAHIDVIFYYLRKKGKYGRDIHVNFTTTDCLFGDKIKGIYSKFIKTTEKMSVISGKHRIADYIHGYYMLCNKAWHTVDYVLFPINASAAWHWVLGILSFHERCIYVYDSMRGALHDATVFKEVDTYATVLPYFMNVVDFYNKRSDISLDGGPYRGKNMLDPFEVILVDDLPSQQDTDCGVYMVSFAEYFIEGRDITDYQLDAIQLRNRLGVLLWNYGRMKQTQNYVSDSEVTKRNECKGLAKRQK